MAVTTQFCFTTIFTRSDTTLPGGLHSRLCHAFPDCSLSLISVDYCRIVADILVKCVPPDGFIGIWILLNSIFSFTLQTLDVSDTHADDDNG